jgi:hypothetical protein
VDYSILIKINEYYLNQSNRGEREREKKEVRATTHKT